MGKNRQVIDQFLIFLLKMKDEILKNRPKIMDFLNSSKFNIQRDPFGKYLRMIDYIGNKDQINMKEFIEFFNLNAGTATRVIDQLVEKNLILRETMNGDRRKVGLKLSEFGLIVYAKQKEIEKGEIGKVLDELSDDDIENLIRILKKVNKIFE